MKITLSGRLLSSGYPATLTWEEGQLSGDGQARLETLALANELEGQAVLATPSGPSTVRDHLKSAFSAIVLMGQLFTPDSKWSGELPELPAIPEDAVG